MISEDVKKFWSQVLIFMTKARGAVPAASFLVIMRQIQEIAFKRVGDGQLVELAQQELPNRTFCTQEWGRIAWRLIHPYSNVYHEDDEMTDERAEVLMEEWAQRDFDEILSAAMGVCDDALADSPELWGDPKGGYEELSQ